MADDSDSEDDRSERWGPYLAKGHDGIPWAVARPLLLLQPQPEGAWEDRQPKCSHLHPEALASATSVFDGLGVAGSKCRDALAVGC